MSFQTTTNAVPAPGIAGDFASTNPRHTVISGPTGLVAASGGVACGAFGWVDTATYTTVANAGQGAPNGFVHNAHNALITIYLGETSLVIPAGLPVGDLFDAGDFWCKNSGATAVVPGMKAYANNVNGLASFAATGSPPTAATVTASIAPQTASITASLAITPTGAGPGTNPGVMNVTAVGSGVIVTGAVFSGTGVVSGKVGAQISGNATVGQWAVDTPQTVASGTITLAYGTMAVTAVASGTILIGAGVTGTSVPAGTTVTQQGNGTPGGVGNYTVTPTGNVSSETMLTQSATETSWYSASFAAPGEVVKITTRWP